MICRWHVAIPGPVNNAAAVLIAAQGPPRAHDPDQTSLGLVYAAAQAQAPYSAIV